MTLYVTSIDLTSGGDVAVRGFTSATNITAAMHERVYVMPPPDGIWEYDLSETVTGIYGGMMMMPFELRRPWTGDRNARGVRVHNPSPGGAGPATSTVHFVVTKVDDYTTETEVPLALQAARVTKDHLFIEVVYGGGCFEHDFSLEWNGKVGESEPPYYELNLVDRSAYDSCRALITTHLRFDVSTPDLKIPEDARVAIRTPAGRTIEASR
ncbi:MAG: hypothetical protein R3B82_29530 [Sandaracinaceae bacterium]